MDALGKTNGKHYLLSFDGPAGSQNYVNIELAKAAKQVDFIAIDGYNTMEHGRTLPITPHPSSTPGKTPTSGRVSSLTLRWTLTSKPACPHPSTSWACLSMGRAGRAFRT